MLEIAMRLRTPLAPASNAAVSNRGSERKTIMSQTFQPYTPPRTAVSSAVDARARFIVRTYNHLFGAILLFAADRDRAVHERDRLRIAEAMMRHELAAGARRLHAGQLAREPRRPHRRSKAGRSTSRWSASWSPRRSSSCRCSCSRHIGARRDPERGARHHARLRRAHRHRLLDAQGLLVPRRASCVGRASARCLPIVAGVIFGFQLGTFFSVGDGRPGRRRRSCTTRRTCSTTSPRTATSAPRSSCSPRSR